MVLITVVKEQDVCHRMSVNGGVSCFVCVQKDANILLDTRILLWCVSRHRAETELDAADRSNSLSGKFTLRVAVVYTVG